MIIQALNSKFAPKGNVFFKKGKGDFIIAKIDNKYASCEISTYGAQVLSYEPNGEENILWMSKKSPFEKGKAIRGGIPVCFPWFGPHKSDPTMPQHGFARIMEWEIDHVFNLSDSSTRIILKCSDNEFTQKYWPYKFEATLTVVVGLKLEVALEVKNTGNESFEYSDALHSYFNISNVENVSISGLKGIQYLDGTDNNKLKLENEEPLLILNEINCRYIDIVGANTITDEGFERKILVEKTGSKTTVVWNPWKETCEKMPDMESEGYKKMICVEAANAYNDEITLKPGESFCLKTTISAEKLN